MLVELQTGAPLFPGSSDVDQLWRSLCCLCSPSFGCAAAVSQCPMFAVSGRPGFRVQTLNPKRFAVLPVCLSPCKQEVTNASDWVSGPGDGGQLLQTHAQPSCRCMCRSRQSCRTLQAQACLTGKAR